MGNRKHRESKSLSSTPTVRKHAIVFDPKLKLTRSSFKDECDVNKIVKTYQTTGMVNHVARVSPQYGDAPEIDFFQAMNVTADLATAEERGELEFDAPEAEAPEAPKEPENGSQAAPAATESTTEDGA